MDGSYIFYNSAVSGVLARALLFQYVLGRTRLFFHTVKAKLGSEMYLPIFG